MPKITPQRKELLEQATRDSVLEAACDLLKEGGWRGFTMDKLAQRMGVSKGTIYNYFRDKREVMLFINRRLTDHIAENLEELIQEEPDSRRVLECMVRNALTGIRDFRFLHRAAEEMARSFHAKDRELLCEMGPSERIYGLVRSILELGIARGVFKPGDPDMLVRILSAMLCGLGDLDSAPEKYTLDTSDPTVLDAIVERVVAAFCLQP